MIANSILAKYMKNAYDELIESLLTDISDHLISPVVNEKPYNLEYDYLSILLSRSDFKSVPKCLSALGLVLDSGQTYAYSFVSRASTAAKIIFLEARDDDVHEA